MDGKPVDFPYNEELAERKHRLNEAMRREDHSDDWRKPPAKKNLARYDVGPEEMYSAQYRAGLATQEEDNG